MKHVTWVLAVCVLVQSSVLAKTGTQSGAIREVGDSVSAAPAVSKAPVAPAVADSSKAATPADSSEPAGRVVELAQDSVAAERAALVARLEFRRDDFADQVKSNETHIQKLAAEVSTYVAQKVAQDTSAVEDSYVKERRVRIAQHRTTIADLKVIVDSLDAQIRAVRESSGPVASSPAHMTADSLQGQTRASEPEDTRPLIRQHPLTFGYQFHYTRVAGVGDDTYVVRMAGFELSYAVRQYLDIGVRDLMLFFNSTVNGTRVGLTFAPTVAASLFPLKRVELEGAIGAIAQVQMGADEPTTISGAPFVSLAAEVWPVKVFSIAPVVRLAYAASRPMYFGAIPSDGSDVIPEGTFWLDLGLSFAFHF